MFSKKTKKNKKKQKKDSKIQIISLLLVISFFLGSILLIQKATTRDIFSGISFDLPFSDAASAKPAIGAFDGPDSNTCSVKGWAYDPDNSRTSIWVHFYEGAPYGKGGKFIAGCQTKVSRPDINKGYGISGTHGFDCKLPSSFRNQGEKNIYIHAIDISGGPNNVISGSPKKINCSTQQGQQTLTVAKAGTGAGTIVSNPSGINCGTTCSKTLPQNTKVTLTASPQSGNTFEGWTGDCRGTSKTCSVSLTQSRNVTATFKGSRGGDPTLPAEFSDGGTVLIFAHQDDDLLWMFPFFKVAQKFVLSAYPATPPFENIVNKTPYNYSQKWETIYGRTDVSTYIAQYKTNPISRQSLVSASVLEAKLKPIMSASTTKRIVTHNNWGEYGHEQHRLVNKVVRKLAAQYGKDVWALSTVVDMRNDIYQDKGSLSMNSFQVTYNQSEFYAVRQLYLDEDIRQKDLLTWTWKSGNNSYPYGKRTYVKLVDKGSDKSSSNAQIAQILKDQPSYRGPYDSESLFGAVMVRNDYCKGPKPAGDIWDGETIDPISCNNLEQPVCERGFYLSKIGSVPDAGGAYTVYTCKANTNSYPAIKEKGKLYGVGIVTMQQGNAVGCGASSPMTCGGDNIPICESGFRRIGTGSITESFTSRYYSCESISGSFTSPRKGGLYGYAVVVQNSNGSIRSCTGPRGETLQFPISCPDYNGVAECANGYRRFMIGTLLAADGSIEKYMSCESM
ncbi:MAG: hypothetical protein IPN70_02270 [Candidatus Moraniibacteriota bacterium]|nr:MAG: hypothetical protein IPN70_02270 [Candidatus Moranbacteria bacterium]